MAKLYHFLDSEIGPNPWIACYNPDMEISSIDLNDIREAFDALAEIICDNWDGNDEPSPTLITKAVDQLFDVLDRHEDNAVSPASERLQADELDELGEYGLTLFQEMSAYADDLGLDDVADQMEDLAFPFAVWLARKNSEIKHIAPVVNALSRKANLISEPHLLKQLYYYINEIVESVSPSISQDLEKTNPMRPWRVLIINRAVIAARSHDRELITSAFDTLIEYLPEDAAQFFEEGVEQMHLVNYPDHVKELMQQYFLLHGSSRTLH